MLFEVCAESVEVSGGSPGQWLARRHALETAAAVHVSRTVLQNNADRFLCQTAVGRKLAADDGEQTASCGVSADEVSSGNTLLVPISRERQRPYAGVGIKDVFATESRDREYAIRFAQEVVDLAA